MSEKGPDNQLLLYSRPDQLLSVFGTVDITSYGQGLKIACLESIAYEKGWITDDDLRRIATPMAKNQYGQYLLSLIKK